MSEPRRTRSQTTHLGRALRTERLTPHMVRVVLGDGGPGRDGLAAFATTSCTDHYVKLLFARPEAPEVDLSDLAALRARLPRELWPVTRTYTVRRWDVERRELSLDFVLHGDDSTSEGIAGPWAARASAGDELWFSGPGGGYAPEPTSDWHLLAGDESALPAIAASLESMPADAIGVAFVEVADASEEQPVAGPAGVELVWLHRDGRRVGELLVERLSGATFRAGRPQVFVHGEAGFVKELRTHLRVKRDVGRDQLSISGYWRLGLNEDGWQSSKSTWNEAVERDEELALARGRAGAHGGHSPSHEAALG
jgi:NADPH-dependent ferric siderophore reductase